MQKHNISGRVVEIGDKQTFDSGFEKRTAIIDTSDGGKFPCPVPVTFKKDKTTLLDAVAVGDQVNVDVTIDGRKWDGPNGVKYFVDITAWSLMKVGETVKTNDAPKYAADLPSALKAYLDNGGTKSDFALFCERVTGKKPERPGTPDYWAKVIAEAAKPKTSEDPLVADDDDLPF